MRTSRTWSMVFLVVLTLVIGAFAALSGCAGTTGPRTEPDVNDWEAFDTPGNWGALEVVGIADDGAIWAKTGSSVVRFDGEGWKEWEGRAVQILPDSAGSAWTAEIPKTSTGTYQGAVVRHLVAGPLQSDRCGPAQARRFAVAADGAVWVGCDQGIARFVDGEAEMMVEDRIVANVWDDPQGSIWATGWVPATGKGWTSSWDDSGRTDHTDTGPIQNAQVGHRPPAFEQALFGPDGSMWVIIERQSGWSADGHEIVAKGVAAFQEGQWSLHQVGRELPAQDPIELQIARDGTVWVGFNATRDEMVGRVSAFDGTTWRHFTSDDGVPVGQIGAIMEDYSGAMWLYTPGVDLGGKGGFSGSAWARYDGTSWHETADPTGGGRDPQYLWGDYGCVTDAQGHLWVGGTDRLYRSPTAIGSCPQPAR